MTRIQLRSAALSASLLLAIAGQPLAWAGPAPSTAPADSNPNWDATSSQILPQVLARSGSCALTAAYRRVSCLVDVEVGLGSSTGCKATLRHTTDDTNHDGIVSKDEIDIQVESMSPEDMQPVMDYVCDTFRSGELGSLRNLLLLNAIRTQADKKGYVALMSSDTPQSPLAALDIKELRLTISRDFAVTGMAIRRARGDESNTEFDLKQIDGKWYIRGSKGRNSLADGGTVTIASQCEYQPVQGVPLLSRLTTRIQQQPASGGDTVTMRQDYSFHDWKLVKRTQPIAPAAATPADSEPPNSRPARQEPARRTSPSDGLKITGLEKYVSPKANFVVCRPIGWKVHEESPGFCLAISVQDPTEQYQVGMVCGANPLGDNRGALAKVILDQLRSKYKNFEVANVRESKDGHKVVFDATYRDADNHPREGRCWLSLEAGNFVFSYCATPPGKFEPARPTLLSILENIRILKNTIPAPPKQVPLFERRLSDGSATFLAPEDWKFQDSGTGHFAAVDPTGRVSFIVAKVDMLTPRLGVTYPGAIVLAYTTPHQAMQTLTTAAGLLKDFKFEDITPCNELAEKLGQVYTAGPVRAEEFTYTGKGKGQTGRNKAYTFGVSWGSRMDTNWMFSHLTVGAPEKEFDAWVPVLAQMVQSYRIDDEFAARYIAAGTARLRQMQADTARIIAKNADDIHNMMQAAYDERQRSQDYIDYQRTTYIRGESDWISGMEGGTVYHSDSWGTQNTTTGESWEGTPYNYVNFEGRNPQYNEQMTKIDNRQLFEQTIGRRRAP